MAESYLKGQKTLWEKEKLLVTSNFSFSHSVFKRLQLQTRKNQGLFGKRLINTLCLFFYTSVSCPEDRVACNGRCIPKGQTCTEVICEYPDFLCRNQQSCLKESDVCNGVNDCGDNSDESACGMLLCSNLSILSFKKEPSPIAQSVALQT